MKNFSTRAVWGTIGLSLALILGVVGVSGQTTTVGAKGSAGQTEETKPTPIMTDIRGVKLGMTKDEVVDILGDPEQSDKRGLFYEFSGAQTMQISLTPEMNVSQIAMFYNGKDSKAPTVSEIFGPDVSVTPADNGSVYKMVRYMDANLWVAYSLINPKDRPMTVITMKWIKAKQ